SSPSQSTDWKAKSLCSSLRPPRLKNLMTITIIHTPLHLQCHVTYTELTLQLLPDIHYELIITALRHHQMCSQRCLSCTHRPYMEVVNIIHPFNAFQECPHLINIDVLWYSV